MEMIIIHTENLEWKQILWNLLSVSHSVVSNSLQPHERGHTRLLSPWDSPGKNNGVGCHFLLQFMKMTSEREVGESCLTLRDPMDCSPPGFPIHGTFQARVLEWGAIAFSLPFTSWGHYLLLKRNNCGTLEEDDDRISWGKRWSVVNKKKKSFYFSNVM